VEKYINIILYSKLTIILKDKKNNTYDQTERIYDFNNVRVFNKLRSFLIITHIKEYFF